MAPSPAFALRSFPSSPPFRLTRSVETSSRAVRPLKGVALAPLCPPPWEAPLLGFRFLFSAIEKAGYVSRGCHPRVPLPRLRFLPAIAAIASDSLVPGLFHPRSTPEVHSSGLSPRTAAQVVAPPEYPLAVITVATAAPSSASGTLQRSLNRLQGFALRPSPFAPTFPLRTAGGRCPPEFHPP